MKVPGQQVSLQIYIKNVYKGTLLSNLVNLSFECGTFSEILKTVSVTPIY